MCLEGMLYKTLSNIPVLKYFTGLISIIILIAALFSASTVGSVIHSIFALYCPLVYLIYYYATKPNKIKNNS